MIIPLAIANPRYKNIFVQKTTIGLTSWKDKIFLEAWNGNTCYIYDDLFCVQIFGFLTFKNEMSLSAPTNFTAF